MKQRVCTGILNPCYSIWFMHENERKILKRKIEAKKATERNERK